MRYDLAIFDLDGTILYTLEDLKNSLNYALTRHGYPARTLEEVRRFVGNGVRKLVERGAPAGTSSQELDRLYETFHVHYKQHDLDNTRPYEGIEALLEKLRGAGLRLAVVSNKVDYGVKDLCGRFFPGAFDLAIGERPGVGKKPAPDMVNEALAQTGVARERAVYIGDSEVDIQTARNAGMDEIIVSWGFRTAEELAPWGPKRVVSDPEALGAALTEPISAARPPERG